MAPLDQVQRPLSSHVNYADLSTFDLGETEGKGGMNLATESDLLGSLGAGGRGFLGDGREMGGRSQGVASPLGRLGASHPWLRDVSLLCACVCQSICHAAEWRTTRGLTMGTVGLAHNSCSGNAELLSNAAFCPFIHPPPPGSRAGHSFSYSRDNNSSSAHH